ncbi:MAG: YcgL domain-containing protein [Gammaproteobacteria bacterium]|nr:YcgL domain-containing protein [Gammaproteobacteria bacterium]
MLCFIYRCSLKPDMYIYLAEEDVFDNVPREIFNSLGIVAFSMELEITPDTRLAREDIETVLKNLEEHGFHLQLPGDKTVETIMRHIAENNAK